MLAITLVIPMGGLAQLQQRLNGNRRPIIILGPARASQVSLLGRDGERPAVNATVELDADLAASATGPFAFVKIDESLYFLNVHRRFKLDKLIFAARRGA